MNRGPLYYIHTPGFNSSNSTTDRALHLLCHALNSAGCLAYLVISDLSTDYDSRWPYFARFSRLNLTHEEWNTPLLNREIAEGHFREGRKAVSVSTREDETDLRVSLQEESTEILVLRIETLAAERLVETIRVPRGSEFDDLTSLSGSQVLKTLRDSMKTLAAGLSYGKSPIAARLPYDWKIVFIDYDESPVPIEDPVAPPAPSLVRSFKRFVVAWLLPPAITQLILKALSGKRPSG